MSERESSADLERLLRWERAGGTWRFVDRRGEAVTIALLRCDGGEEADSLTSTERDVLRYTLQVC